MNRCNRLARLLAAALGMLLALAGPATAAPEAATLAKLAAEDAGERMQAIDAIAADGDEAAVRVLTALQDGLLRVTPKGQVFIKQRGGLVDALTGAAVDVEPEDLDKVAINNRMRAQLEGVMAGLRIFSTDARLRLEAARSIEPDAKMLPTLDKALARETVAEIRQVLEVARAASQLGSGDTAARLAAIDRLSGSRDPKIKTLLLSLLEDGAQASGREADSRVREAAAAAVRAIDRRLMFYDFAQRLFAGVSLGSILMLAALGLAITYGLLGVINMAHGEMLMIGAYAAYATQALFRARFPGALDWYLVCAVPVSFVSAGLVGVVLERTVIRWLYGRPLETLLATWGISLVLIQAVRELFGAQNVEVSNPAWMSGGIELAALALPWNRIVIIGFALAVLLLMWLMLTRTRFGLFVRAVTQNRPMAACMGVPTARVDMLAFGLGSGIAGLAGCALSQIGNVGPDLGQSYIIDSFMVVVLGGVGQLAGTVYAALGLGVASKFLEPYIGAVPAKILILVLIIAFIQKRPQGLFALRGRSVEA